MCERGFSMFPKTRSALVDANEFVRFVVTGVVATLGNITAVFLMRFFVPFKVALLAGIVAGVTLSFTLSKLFAFASRSWDRAGTEAARFLTVYAVSCVVYWALAVVCEQFFLARSPFPEIADLGGVVVGAGAMTVVSYLGHRFFTYRTYQRADERLGRVP
jgi:putative flippase GtrA